jgi:hypothetical protein
MSDVIGTTDTFGIVRRVPESLAPWLGLSDGGKCYPLGARPEDFTLPMIANALSNICRYNGQTNAFWSVAAHSIEVAHQVYEKTGVAKYALDALMHDASESVLCDIPKPLKPMILNYDKWEDSVERAIAERFGLRYPRFSLIGTIDANLVVDEVRNFFPPGSAIWKRYGLVLEEPRLVLTPLYPVEGRAMFIDKFLEYNGGMP